MNKKRAASFGMAALLLLMPVMEIHATEQKDTENEGDVYQAAEEVTTLEDANETLEAYGAEEKEWEEIYIDSVEDLKKLSKNCWLDTWSWNKKIYLQEDLDLTGADFNSIPTFGGYFDGQGHTISGWTTEDPLSYTGLFCYTQKTAVIRNLKVKGTVRPSGRQMVVGGIVGDNSGILMNCSFEGIIEGSDYVGGITGFNEISGILINCTGDGKITGTHYTGGIAGNNMGNIVSCTNKADVNISDVVKEKSIDGIDIAQYTTGLFDSGDESENGKEETMNSNTIDSGGIAGLSTGIIQHSTNQGKIGYEHIGYNIGGIAGRTSGYVYACQNQGAVYGRKDVGGIAGQAEPYVAVDLTRDIAFQLAENIDKMHDLTDRMLDDAGTESDTVSGRIAVIQDFTDKALADTSFLADQTVEWTDGMVGSVNEAINRLDYVLDETARENGVLDNARDAAGNVKDAAGKLKDTVEALDIYQYMTSEEKERYDGAREGMENASKEHSGYREEAVKAYNNYYINIAREGRVNDLRPVVNGSVDQDLINSTDYKDFAQVEDWVHYNEDDGTTTEFPASEDPQRQADQEVLDKASELIDENASQIAEDSSDYADKKYKNENSSEYAEDMSSYLQTMSDIVTAHESEMTENTVNELEKAVDYTKDAAGNLEDAGDEAQKIFYTINDMPDIQMPGLGENYRSKTNSLTSNLQGLSENMGYLNNEMSASGDVLLDDLEKLNDQFSIVMRLYTDAIDGVLDMDYSDVYEDHSQEDANTSTNAAVADCQNKGEVRGDLNVAGIAGTMAIEYDFDLESDVTGIEDAKMNSTFLTKCVLRGSVNTGKITAQKSYVGGVCGLQEMGIILSCENYGKIVSSAGSYAGGIAGESRSHIVSCYAKCSLEGGEYVAGIAGAGSSIEKCCAMVRVREASAFSGAIAGKMDESGTLTDNFFVSDEIAGIDRISYSGKAEPVSYYEMMRMEGIPNAFRRMSIAFYADEEEVGTAQCPYGGNIAQGMYPEIPVKEGFYADWDVKELKNVVQDEEVTVEYVRYLTTIASKQLRSNDQSVILADGRFYKDALLELSELGKEDAALEDVAEHWEIKIPADGSTVHQIRYQAPDGQTKDVDIYVRQGEDQEWVQTQTELMGIYHLFKVEGETAEILVCIPQKEIPVGLLVGALILAVGILAALIGFRRFWGKPKSRRSGGRKSLTGRT